MKTLILKQALEELKDAIDYEDELWIIAVAHGYRKPTYWIKRKI